MARRLRATARTLRRVSGVSEHVRALRQPRPRRDRARAWQIGRANSNPFRRRHNVLPTTLVPILRKGPDGSLELFEARWGLIPLWWKEPKPPQSTFNARSEDAAGR